MPGSCFYRQPGTEGGTPKDSRVCLAEFLSRFGTPVHARVISCALRFPICAYRIFGRMDEQCWPSSGRPAIAARFRAYRLVAWFIAGGRVAALWRRGSAFGIGERRFLIMHKGGKSVAHVVRDQGESFESLFKRFKKAVQQDRIFSEMRRRRFYEKPSQERKRKAAKKARKSRRTTLKMQSRHF